MDNLQYILVFGNVVSGLTFVGPFEDVDRAAKYGGNFNDEEWMIAPIGEPHAAIVGDE